jgi:two-component sensor histidine kinase
MGHGRDLYGLHRNGDEFPVEVGLNPIRTPQGMMVLASVINITERKHQESQLKAALKEKELLLAEIHHRVKNNLQIIDSLLGMQSDMLLNETAVSLLRESQNRVKSMALIHQILYESSDFANVDFSSVLRALVSNLEYSYALDASRVNVNIDTDPVFLSIDISIPLGLIINELCSNAMKYAFGEHDSGTIEISLKYTEPNVLQVYVADNGAGIPDEFDLENSSTLGLQLVYLLSEQISAELIFQRRQPTSFTLNIPIEAD